MTQYFQASPITTRAEFVISVYTFSASFFLAQVPTRTELDFYCLLPSTLFRPVSTLRQKEVRNSSITVIQYHSDIKTLNQLAHANPGPRS